MVVRCRCKLGKKSDLTGRGIMEAGGVQDRSSKMVRPALLPDLVPVWLVSSADL